MFPPDKQSDDINGIGVLYWYIQTQWSVFYWIQKDYIRLNIVNKIMNGTGQGACISQGCEFFWCWCFLHNSSKLGSGTLSLKENVGCLSL